MDWTLIDINNEKFVLKVDAECNEKFVVSLSNFKVLWRETIALAEVLHRARTHNPFTTVEEDEVQIIKRTITAVADSYHLNINEDDLLFKMKYYIAGVPIHIHWKLVKCDQDVFYEQITKKLLVSLLNVQDQRNELMDIVKKKDAEINQYKVEGATLIRKHIATQPFVEQEFDRKFQLEIDSGLFDLTKNATGNTTAIKNMCNYRIKKYDTVNVVNSLKNVSAGPSQVKISKKSVKQRNPLRKFQLKTDSRIKYENNSEEIGEDVPSPM